MITGNKGEWSEPYVLLKLLADGKLFLGDQSLDQIEGLFYPIVRILRHEKDRNVEFSYRDNLVIVRNKEVVFEIPILRFIENAKICFEEIRNSRKGEGSFAIPQIESFLNSISITTLKAKSSQKNDITIQIEDPNTFSLPVLGFSVKSQLGRPSSLVNASGPTNFTFIIDGLLLSPLTISEIGKTKKFSEKLSKIEAAGAQLKFESVEHPIFKSNLQTIDYNFDAILANMVLKYYSSSNSSSNTVSELIKHVTAENPIGYDLKINDEIYKMIMKRFLVEYALGMRAGEVWKRNYQASGGYLIVRSDGELTCYHFYFMKNFEEYLFNNTKLETGSPSKIGFGSIYSQNGIQKIKLNLQIRFSK